MVLDVLALAKQEIHRWPIGARVERCLRVRWQNINGTNGLACITPVSSVVGPDNKLTLRPLPGLPVIRDLVVDLTTFTSNLKNEALSC